MSRLSWLSCLLFLSSLAAQGCSSSAKVTLLAVEVTGAGRVYSDDAHATSAEDKIGIACTSDGTTSTGNCATDLTSVETFTLIAEPAAGHVFDHWEVDPTNGVPSFETSRDSPVDPTLPLMVSTQTSATRNVRAFFK